MSRTIRKKGKVPEWLYDKSVAVKSDKLVTREYTRWNWTGEGSESTKETYSYYPIYIMYLPKEEWTLSNKDRVAYHSNKWHTHRKNWVKRIWAKKRRQWDRQEFARLANYEDYEPIWFTTKIDTWWWD